MSASQARFLSLTARKTNVEYEGQQINQQRTALSNESSNYYSQLTSMTVPTPPSSADYTKVTYTFNDGSEKNTVTSLIAKQDGTYMLNYVQEIPVETMVVQGTSVISQIEVTPATATTPAVYDYFLGSDQLQDTLDDTTIPPMPTSVADVTANRSAYTQRLLAAGIPNDVLNNMSDKEIYNKTELENADYNETTTMSLSGLHSYVFGTSTETREIKNATARVEQDVTGRYIALIIYPSEADAAENKNGVHYNLTTTTESDDAAYNDAMNQYYYDKAQYDQQIQEVNSKIEIIQVQDKNLELKLKQLDTEENAIQTEMDAVKKVISKNIESSFKTFNA